MLTLASALPSLPRHLHPMEEPAPACPGERPDSLSGETDQTRLLPQNPDKVDDGFGHQEPTRKAKAEGEEVRGEDDEGGRWREEAQEDSVEQGSECYEDAWGLTEVLLPKQQPSSLEGTRPGETRQTTETQIMVPVVYCTCNANSVFLKQGYGVVCTV